MAKKQWNIFYLQILQLFVICDIVLIQSRFHVAGGRKKIIASCLIRVQNMSIQHRDRNVKIRQYEEYFPIKLNKRMSSFYQFTQLSQMTNLYYMNVDVNTVPIACVQQFF